MIDWKKYEGPDGIELPPLDGTPFLGYGILWTELDGLTKEKTAAVVVSFLDNDMKFEGLPGKNWFTIKDSCGYAAKICIEYFAEINYPEN